MSSEANYEQLYKDLLEGLEEMHRNNINKTKTALRSLLIVPTIFLILLFLTQSSKTAFLILWIASMFIIACILIIIEYQDYNLKKLFLSVTEEEAREKGELTEATDISSEDEYDDSTELSGEKAGTVSGKDIAAALLGLTEVNDSEAEESITADEAIDILDEAEATELPEESCTEPIAEEAVEIIEKAADVPEDTPAEISDEPITEEAPEIAEEIVVAETEKSDEDELREYIENALSEAKIAAESENSEEEAGIV